MRALIVGSELLGRALALDLLDAGHEVRVLDERAEQLGALPDGFGGLVLHGSPLHHATLANALDGCDAIAAVSQDDRLNFVTAFAARRELHVPLALAAVAGPGLAEALQGVGVHVICPTTRTARELAGTLVRSRVESELLLGREVALFRIDAPARLVGRRLAELERPGQIVAVAVERAGRASIAVPDLVVEAGDVLHLAARHRDAVSELAGD